MLDDESRPRIQGSRGIERHAADNVVREDFAIRLHRFVPGCGVRRRNFFPQEFVADAAGQLEPPLGEPLEFAHLPLQAPGRIESAAGVAKAAGRARTQLRRVRRRRRRNAQSAQKRGQRRREEWRRTRTAVFVQDDGRRERSRPSLRALQFGANRRECGRLDFAWCARGAALPGIRSAHARRRGRFDDERPGHDKPGDFGVAEFREQPGDVAVDRLAPELLARTEMTAHPDRANPRVERARVERNQSALAPAEHANRQRGGGGDIRALETIDGSEDLLPRNR